MERAIAVLILVLVLVSAAIVASQRIGQVEVYGRVLDWRGRPVEGAVIEVYQDGALVARGRSYENGIYDLWLDPGVYTFKFYARGLAPRELTAKVPSGVGAYQLGDISLDRGVVLRISATSFTVHAGGSYEVPVTLENRELYWEEVRIGVAAPRGWEVGLYSGSLRVSGALLPPGASESYTLRIRVPPNATGTYAVPINVSYTRGYTVQLSFRVAEPDATLVTATPSELVVAPGSLLEAQVTVRNPYSWRAGFNLTVEAPRGWPAKILDSEGRVVEGGVLEPGSSFEARLEAVPRGSGTIVVRACVAGRCGEARLRVEARREMDVLVFSEGFVAASCRPGREARFRLELSNLGVTGTLVHFSVEGLPGNYTWRLVDDQGNVFKELYLKPGGKAVFYLEARPPLGERAKTVAFRLVAKGAASTANATLSLNVLNRVELRVVTENFYVEARPGGRAVFRLTVANRGDAAVHSLTLTAGDAPRGWRVDVKPSSVAVLPPGGNATFTVTVAVPGDAKVGDYYIRLALEWPSGSEERLLHVAVLQGGGAAVWGWVLVAAVVAAIALIYIKYGRR